MTTEDLSAATADRHERKMVHDVQNTARVRAPPRPDPPVFGRESMEDAISARIVASDEPPPSSTATPPSARENKPTTQDDIETFFTVFQRIETNLHAYLSNDDKDRIRMALTPPHTMHPMAPDQAAVLAVCAVLVVFIVCHVFKQQQTSQRAPYRSSTSSESTDHTERMSWNIQRLLKPISRSH